MKVLEVGSGGRAHAIVTSISKSDKVSKEGIPHAIEFPRAKIAGAEFDFSYSGVKSAVLNYLNQCEMKGI